MIALDTLVNNLNSALNLLLNEENRRFAIIPDGGEYTPPTRKYNDITTYINGVAQVGDSAITPISGIEVVTQTLNVAILVEIEQTSAEVKDEDVFLPVRNAIAQYAATARKVLMKDDDENDFSVTITATQPSSGALLIRPTPGRSIEYDFSVMYTFVQNGVNSRDIVITFEGETIPFEDLTITRVPVHDGGAFADTGTSAKNFVTQTALEITFNSPALTNGVLSNALMNFILTGDEIVYEVSVSTPFSDEPTVKQMIFGQSNAAVQGVDNMGNSVTLVEAYIEPQGGV